MCDESLSLILSRPNKVLHELHVCWSYLMLLNRTVYSLTWEMHFAGCELHIQTLMFPIILTLKQYVNTKTIWGSEVQNINCHDHYCQPLKTYVASIPASHINRSLDLLLGIESLPNLFWRELRKPSFKGCGPWHRVLIYKEIIVIIREPLNIFLFWERHRVNRCNTHQNNGSTNTKRNLTLLPWSCAVLRVLVRPLRRSTPL